MTKSTNPNATLYTPAETKTATPPILEIKNLVISFHVDGRIVPVVRNVSIDVPRGKTVALVGESGCGKTVTALSILRLLPQPPARIKGGTILFHDPATGGAAHPDLHVKENRFLTVAARFRRKTHRFLTGAARIFHHDPKADPIGTSSSPVDLLTLPDKDIRRLRGNRIAMIFQDPMSALHPTIVIGDQIAEAVQCHRRIPYREALSLAVDLLRRVGLPAPEFRARQFPHQLSGGMRQRVMIAMALACRPALLIADEPTTALDATVQRQIIDRLKSLQSETGMSLLLVTHDLGLVADFADFICVMYAGRIVEHGAAASVLTNPFHPYTQGLVQCSPSHLSRGRRLPAIPGSVPELSALPSGCEFHPRCALSIQRAKQSGREVIRIEDGDNGVRLRCCVEPYPGEPSGRPTLRVRSPDHHAACWEDATEQI